MDDDANATITCSLPAGVQYAEDTVTGNAVSNKFTGSDAVDGVSLDGSDSDQNITYLTRADFAGTFPKTNTPTRAMTDNVKALNLYTADDANGWINDADEAITTGAKNGLKIEDNGETTDLGFQLGSDFNDPRWDALLDQLTVDEMENLYINAYGGLAELKSVGKSKSKDADGPAQIGGFKIVSESSVAAGIRRIEAVTGRNLLIRANLQEAMLHNVANTLKANNVTALPVRAEAVMAENKAMSKELEELKAKIAASKVDSLFNNAEDADGVKIASAYFTGTTGDTLRGMCDSIRDKAVNPVVAVLVGKAEDKITMAVTVNKLAQEKGLKAGVLVKELAAIAGGKGGGKPDFAMAGLKDETKIDEALAAVGAIVKKALGE